MSFAVKDGDFTPAKRDEVIKAGQAGLKLTNKQVRQLEEAVRTGNRAGAAAEALAKRGR